ncbi:MAG: pyruvate kinase alpha/beta domain-containing protein [bacterium]
MFWENSGRENTANTVELAMDKAQKYNINQLVVASNEGDTVFKLLEKCNSEDINIVCITHHDGFREPGKNEMSPETRKELINNGVKVYTGTHILAGVDRSLRKEYGGLYPPEVIANTLRMFGQGLKVCVEISIMALDAGLISYENEVIAIGGTGRGADTAAIIKPGHSNNVFATRVVEILCRPGQ